MMVNLGQCKGYMVLGSKGCFCTYEHGVPQNLEDGNQDQSSKHE